MNYVGKITSLSHEISTDDLLRQIAELSRGIVEVEEYRETKKGKLQRTLYSGSSAASSKVKKVRPPQFYPSTV